MEENKSYQGSSSESEFQPILDLKDPKAEYEVQRTLFRYILWAIGIALVVNVVIAMIVPSSNLEPPTIPEDLIDISASPDGKYIVAVGIKSVPDVDEELQGDLQYPRNVILRNENYGTGAWSSDDYYGASPITSLQIDWGSGRGICIGNDGTYLITSDSAHTWELKSIELDEFKIGQLEDFSMNWDSGEGICIGGNGAILRTTDFGYTWNYVNEVFQNHPKVIEEEWEGEESEG